MTDTKNVPVKAPDSLVELEALLTNIWSIVKQALEAKRALDERTAKLEKLREANKKKGAGLDLEIFNVSQDRNEIAKALASLYRLIEGKEVPNLKKLADSFCQDLRREFPCAFGLSSGPAVSK
jgi:hypothetical protein